MYCGHCGSEVPAASPFCRDCGAPIDSNKDARLGTPEGEMYPLLAAANLLRIRHQWDEATAKCIEVLRRYPNNASAHSLLGDIYRDQNMLRDAVEWYKLALELDPSSRSDRMKLDCLVDELYTRHRATSKQLESPPPAGGLARRTLRDWLELTQLNRPIGKSMVAVVLLLVIALLVVTAFQGSSPPANSHRGMHFPLPRHPQPGLVANPPGLTGGRAATPAPTADRDYAEMERALLARLRTVAAASTHPYTVPWLAMDPRSNTLQVALTVPPLGSNQDTKRSIINTSLATLRIATEMNRELISLQARVSLLVPGQESKTQLAFVGEVSASRLAGLPGTNLSPGEAANLFTGSWWHQPLRSTHL